MDDDTTTGMTYDDWIGHKAYDRNRDKIGEIKEIFYDDTTGRPEWITISTGLFGTSNSFAPIMGSQRHEDGLMLDVTKDAVKDAPSIDADGHLEESEEQRLYRHYAIDYTSGEGRAIVRRKTLTEDGQVSGEVREEEIDLVEDDAGIRDDRR